MHGGMAGAQQRRGNCWHSSGGWATKASLDLIAYLVDRQ